MEGRVGEVGEPVGGGPRGAPQRGADLLGGGDGDDGSLPSQQGGEEGGLCWGAERGGGRGDRGWWTRVGPTVLFPGGDGDGLEGWSVSVGRRGSSHAGDRKMDIQEG